jgi:4-amino-4-deoxy-L-arabinose transferase-like glycosyltransferase
VLMALLAMFYLRQRRMHWSSFSLWILLALIVPVIGPFLVIVNRPGEWHPDPFPSARLRQRIGDFFRNQIAIVALQLTDLGLRYHFFRRLPPRKK